MSSEAPAILLIDDDPDVAEAAGLALGRHGMQVRTAGSLEEAEWRLAAEPADVILLDLNLTRGAVSGDEGLGFLRSLMRRDPEAVVVVVTAHSGVNVAVAAIQAGAHDFVMKPWRNEKLVAVLKGALDLRNRRAASNTAPGSSQGETALLGSHAAIQRARALIARAGGTRASMLIQGGAGVGKSLSARLVARASQITSSDIRTYDLQICPDNPEAAARPTPNGQAGAPQLAIFENLDALSRVGQAQLLDLLTSWEGADPPTRIITTTRQPRDTLYDAAVISPDLLYRLNTLEIVLPDLRDRPDDIAPLARHFLGVFSQRHGVPLKTLTPPAAEELRRNRWLGNVRELQHAMERAVLLNDGPAYGPDAFVLDAGEAAGEGSPDPGSDLSLEQAERAWIDAALRRNGFNVSHTARDLGVTRATLYRRMAKHGL